MSAPRLQGLTRPGNLPQSISRVTSYRLVLVAHNHCVITFSESRSSDRPTAFSGICILDAMKAPGTPRFSGPHRRWGRPFSEVSRFAAIVSIVLGLLAIVVLVIVVRINWSTVPAHK